MVRAPDDYRWLSDTIRGCYLARTPAELAAHATRCLVQRLRMVYSGLEEISNAGSDFALHGVTHTVPVIPDWMAYVHDHPVLPLLRAMPLQAHVRTLVTRAQFERTDYYNGVARPMGWNDCLILRVQGAPTVVTLSAFRDRIFQDGEKRLLACLQPHVSAAWRRLAAPARAMLYGGERRLRVTAALAPVGLEPSLLARLRLYFPGWRDLTRLPGPVRDWARAASAALRTGSEARPLRSLTVEGAHGTLFACYFPLADSAAAELRFIERPAELTRWSSALNLSPREREVLHWLAEGKRDGEIARILGLAPKTVGKHVEHVLAKLGVRNRTAAAALGVGV